MILLNKDTFEESIKEGLVVVEFFKTNGCPNCTAMIPVMEQFEKDNPQIKVCRYEVKDATEVPQGYQFRMFPGIFSFKDGIPMRGYSGVKTPQQMSLLYATPNDLKITAFDYQALADFFKDEVKNFNQGTGVPLPKAETNEQKIVEPLPVIENPAEVDQCDSCQ